jgi:anti-sigma B factor antagonist
MIPVDTAGPGDVGGDLDIHVDRVSPSTAVFTLIGEADLHRAPALRDEIAEVLNDGIHDLVIDLSEVTFVDSMTLGVLLGAMKRLRPQGGRLCIVVSDPNIRRIFEITLLDRVFPLYEDAERALVGLAGADRSDADA